MSLIRSIIGLYTPVIRPICVIQLRTKVSHNLADPAEVSQILRKDEFSVAKSSLPSYIKSVQCNQLASNVPIEDRIRISSIQIPGQKDPTLLLGVFDGHGGGTTADLISRRLFNYISLSLYPEKLDLTDLHYSPPPKHDPTLRPFELENLQAFIEVISKSTNVKTNEIKDDTVEEQNKSMIDNLKASFRQCDEDLSREIQRELTSSQASHAALHYYLSAAVSGCCCIVMILNEGTSYVASVGDCRAVLGSYSKSKSTTIHNEDLIDEHNCYNRAETRRLASTHPASEQNSIVKHNRLLGHLMPFRAFGDFNYKWPVETIRSCGLTRAFGNSVIAANYETPPYLIAEPDIKEIDTKKWTQTDGDEDHQNCLVLATDGLWELFESSRDVIETIAGHSKELKLDGLNDGHPSTIKEGEQNHEADLEHAQKRGASFDENCATHVLRNALCFGSQPLECTANVEELERLQHARLEAMLTLPKSISRNFRDDISTIIIKMKN